MTTARIALVFLAVALGAGCKSKPEPESTPPAAPTDEGQSPDKDPNKSKIRIDPKIQELCGIDASEANFDFDSAKLSSGAKKVLDALAQCFIDGPGKDRNLSLVGHADPRGTEEYNFALGQKRAGSVGTYLGGKGLGDDRVESSSRGELDATGTDENSWAEDRRVDVLLAE